MDLDDTINLSFELDTKYLKLIRKFDKPTQS